MELLGGSKPLAPENQWLVGATRLKQVFGPKNLSSIPVRGKKISTEQRAGTFVERDLPQCLADPAGRRVHTGFQRYLLHHQTNSMQQYIIRFMPALSKIL